LVNNERLAGIAINSAKAGGFGSGIAKQEQIINRAIPVERRPIFPTLADDFVYIPFSVLWSLRFRCLYFRLFGRTWC
jgi:hypothetical protein